MKVFDGALNLNFDTRRRTSWLTTARATVRSWRLNC